MCAVSLVDPHGRWSYPAGITGLSQFIFTALNASGQLILPSANGLAIGVIDDAPSMSGATLGSDDEFSGGFVVGTYYGIVFSGVIKVRAGANLNPMVAVAADASGHAVAASGSGTVILGVTMAACSSGDLVSVNVRTTGALHN